MIITVPFDKQEPNVQEDGKLVIGVDTNIFTIIW